MKISGIFLESENFQNLKMIDLNLKVKIFKEIFVFKKVRPKSGKVKNFQRNYLESGKPKSENFQGLRLQKSK